MKKISCVIMDWAGTAVDFGCFYGAQNEAYKTIY